MGRLPVISGREILNVALNLGFSIMRQKGSHLILRKEKRMLVIPMHANKPIKKGTLVQILKMLEISREDFDKYF